MPINAGLGKTDLSKLTDISDRVPRLADKGARVKLSSKGIAWLFGQENGAIKPNSQEISQMRNPAGPRSHSPLAPPQARWAFSEYLATRMGETSQKISSHGREQPRLVSDAAERFPALIPRDLNCGISFRHLHPPRHRQRQRIPQTCNATSSSQLIPSSSLLQTQIPSSQGHFKPKFLMSRF